MVMELLIHCTTACLHMPHVAEGKCFRPCLFHLANASGRDVTPAKQRRSANQLGFIVCRQVRAQRKIADSDRLVQHQKQVVWGILSPSLHKACRPPAQPSFGLSCQSLSGTILWSGRRSDLGAPLSCKKQPSSSLSAPGVTSGGSALGAESSAELLGRLDCSVPPPPPISQLASSPHCRFWNVSTYLHA